MIHAHSSYSATDYISVHYNIQGLDVAGEERARRVPALSSSEYGHRPPVETPDRHHVRVGLVKREFYRATGTNIGQ